MGKKSKILYFSILIVNIVCFVLDLLPINFPFFRISFAVSLIIMGLWLLVRAFQLKIDSSMFFGTALLGFGILNFVQYFLKAYTAIDINQFWPYYLFVLSLASLVTGLYFKDCKQFKFFILFLGFGFIVLLFVQNIIALWLMIVLLCVWFVAYFAINLINAKRGKNGR